MKELNKKEEAKMNETFEHLKYLRVREGSKVPKLNYNPGDGNFSNLVKIEKFFRKLELDRSAEEIAESVTEETLKNVLQLFTYNMWGEDYWQDGWDEFRVDKLEDVTSDGKQVALKFQEGDVARCYKVSKMIRERKFSFILIINYSNTLPNKFSPTKFSWRMYDEYYNCKVFSFNYSAFRILQDSLEIFFSNNQVGDKELKTLDKILGKFMAVFKRRWFPSEDLFEPYVKKILIEYEKYVNFVDNKRISREDERLYAKAFQTKKNIKKETLSAMKDNLFLKDFSFVELDDMVDLEKFKALSEYFSEYRTMMNNILPNKEDKVDFRIRRLGNYRALGLYFPFYDTIAVDVDGIESFVHECGHWLDHKKLNNASLTDAFIEKITIPFKEDFKKRNDDKKAYASSSIYYWCSSREVFARAFEVYIKFKYFKDKSCPFLKTESEYSEDIAYTWLVENVGIITNYFNQFKF